MAVSNHLVHLPFSSFFTHALSLVFHHVFELLASQLFTLIIIFGSLSFVLSSANTDIVGMLSVAQNMSMEKERKNVRIFEKSYNYFL